MNVREECYHYEILSMELAQQGLLDDLEEKLKSALLSPNISSEIIEDIRESLARIEINLTPLEELTVMFNDAYGRDSFPGGIRGFKKRFKEYVSMAEKLGIKCYGLDEQETNAS